MTSGNVSDEPIAHEDDDALGAARRASPTSCCCHDRPIHTRTDDSVLRAVPRRRPLLLRRSRGFVPDSLPLPAGRRGRCSPAAPSSRARSASPRARGRGSATTSATSSPTRCCRPTRRGSSTSSACSRSCPRSSPTTSTPTTSRPATRSRARASRPSRSSTTTPTSPPAWPSTARRGRAAGAIYDGSGYGRDGSVWGGEILVGDLRDFERAAHLWPVRLPGRRPRRRAAVADGGRVAARGGLGRPAAGPGPARRAGRRARADRRCRRRGRRAWGGCSTPSPRCAGCATR